MMYANNPQEHLSKTPLALVLIFPFKGFAFLSFYHLIVLTNLLQVCIIHKYQSHSIQGENVCGLE